VFFFSEKDSHSSFFIFCDEYIEYMRKGMGRKSLTRAGAGRFTQTLHADYETLYTTAGDNPGASSFRFYPFSSQAQLAC